jgi:hypothetical protein
MKGKSLYWTLGAWKLELNYSFGVPARRQLASALGTPSGFLTVSSQLRHLLKIRGANAAHNFLEDFWPGITSFCS